ncbi:Pollen-specific leucine-rich repeat extensin-like protein 1 [Ananas comosus]|uniref:Cell wall hydroxyproline-rich glycoprotein n=1 Tax=Ananas comosus TaxID=4615 RepID=A0A199VK25_ANACO|nr:Pollen-specific leucine-rich repeat extensin-like protein 1 [Ananas comosus]
MEASPLSSLPFLLLLLLLSAAGLLSLTSALSDAETVFIARRQLLTFHEHSGDLPEDFEFGVQIDTPFPNQRLRRAYIALQAWKHAIYSDPSNFTGNWSGADVCSYAGVFCSPALDDPSLTVVSGVDLNGADIAGYLPAELGLLTDLALFHINSNRFCGIIPKSFSRLVLMYELDVSNNLFVGPFPVVLDVSHNVLTGVVPEGLCRLPRLANFSFSYNYFKGEAEACTPVPRSEVLFDDKSNCLGSSRPNQKSAKECAPVISRPVDCSRSKCSSSPSRSAPSPKPLTPSHKPSPKPIQPPKPTPKPSPKTVAPSPKPTPTPSPKHQYSPPPPSQQTLRQTGPSPPLVFSSPPPPPQRPLDPKKSFHSPPPPPQFTPPMIPQHSPLPATASSTDTSDSPLLLTSSLPTSRHSTSHLLPVTPTSSPVHSHSSVTHHHPVVSSPPPIVFSCHHHITIVKSPPQLNPHLL